MIFITFWRITRRAIYRQSRKDAAKSLVRAVERTRNGFLLWSRGTNHHVDPFSLLFIRWRAKGRIIASHASSSRIVEFFASARVPTCFYSFDRPSFLPRPRIGNGEHHDVRPTLLQTYAIILPKRRGIFRLRFLVLYVACSKALLRILCSYSLLIAIRASDRLICLHWFEKYFV